MRKRRSKAQQLPPRRPHPDPAVEVKLQQILSLQRAAARNENQLDALHASLEGLTETVGKHPGRDYHRRRLSEIERLKNEIERVNSETAAAHSEIQELCAKIGDEDLLWLGARPNDQ